MVAIMELNNDSKGCCGVYDKEEYGCKSSHFFKELNSGKEAPKVKLPTGVASMSIVSQNDDLDHHGCKPCFVAHW